jgi:hypothetical protein
LSLIDVTRLVASFSLGAAAVGAAETVHLGLSRSDEFLECAKRLFVTNVLADWFGGETFPPRCPESRPELEGYLARRGYKPLNAGGQLYLMPERRFRGDLLYAPIVWKRLQIVPAIEQWEIPGSRKLSPQEKATVAEQILAAMRPVPLFVGSQVEQGTPDERIASPDGETAMRQLFLWIDARRLKAVSCESVIAVLTSEGIGGTSRLAYGEVRDGRLRVLWDSPLFLGFLLNMGYRDVNGDATEEILLWSKWGNSLEGRQLLTILDIKGNELTRQEQDCGAAPSTGEWYSVVLPEVREKQAVFCPIIADEMELVRSSDGKNLEILAEGVWHPDAESQRRCRYRLKRGRYVRE